MDLADGPRAIHPNADEVAIENPQVLQETSIFKCPVGRDDENILQTLHPWVSGDDHRQPGNFMPWLHRPKIEDDGTVWNVPTWYMLNAMNQLGQSPHPWVAWRHETAAQVRQWTQAQYTNASIRFPARTVSAADGAAMNQSYRRARISGRHPALVGEKHGSSNHLFLDGHVAGVTTTIYQPPEWPGGFDALDQLIWKVNRFQ
jgi:prepilin-type processing-associated H-X9-DG protein